MEEGERILVVSDNIYQLLREVSIGAHKNWVSTNI